MVPLVEDDICSLVDSDNDESSYTEDMICAGGVSGAQVCSVQYPEHIISMSLHNLGILGLLL